jgi:hypothetical protein
MKTLFAGMLYLEGGINVSEDSTKLLHDDGDSRIREG